MYSQLLSQVKKEGKKLWWALVIACTVVWLIDLYQDLYVKWFYTPPSNYRDCVPVPEHCKSKYQSIT